MATRVGRGQIQLAVFDGPFLKTPPQMRKITQILHQPSYSQFCPKFRCHGNRRPSGENAIGTIRWPVPHKPPYRRKNLAKISYTSRVIANFVPNFVAMATGVGRGECDWQHSMAHPRKPPIDAKISQISLTQTEF